MSRLQLLTLNCQNFSYMAPVKSHIIPVTILDILDQCIVPEAKESVQIIPSGQERVFRARSDSHHID